MSGESLIMDEGRDENGNGSGGGPEGGSTVNVVGSSNSDDSGSPGAPSPSTPRTTLPLTSTILRNSKGHRGGRYNSNRGAGKPFPPSRRPRHSSGGEVENNVGGGRSISQSSNQGPVRLPKAPSPSLERQQPRRRIRSNKGKWKPYHTLTWEEKKERDLLETLRAEEKRTQLTHLGYPQAPYNTTQFLMADHNTEYGNSDGLDMPSSDESSTAEDDWMSMDRGYDQEWSRVYSEHLNSLSKTDLIAQLLRTEQEKNKMEHRIRALEKEVSDLTPQVDATEMLVDAAH